LLRSVWTELDYHILLRSVWTELDWTILWQSFPARRSTWDVAGFEHFTETFSNYNFYYYSIPEEPYSWFSTGQTTACNKSTTWS
jgi:hypothetical protein